MSIRGGETRMRGGDTQHTSNRKNDSADRTSTMSQGLDRKIHQKCPGRPSLGQPIRETLMMMMSVKPGMADKSISRSGRSVDQSISRADKWSHNLAGKHSRWWQQVPTPLPSAARIL